MKVPEPMFLSRTQLLLTPDPSRKLAYSGAPLSASLERTAPDKPSSCDLRHTSLEGRLLSVGISGIAALTHSTPSTH